MSWCPNCKNEYVDGIKSCADCGEELVDSLEAEDSTAPDGRQEQKEGEALWNEVPGVIPQMPSAPVFKGLYQSNTKKAEENRSSAYMLMLIGGFGLVFIVLFLSGAISVPLLEANKYMVSGGMGCLFLLFLVMGVVSFNSSRTYRQKAKEDNELICEIRKWCVENLTAQTVDGELFLTKEDYAAREYSVTKEDSAVREDSVSNGYFAADGDR